MMLSKAEIQIAFNRGRSNAEMVYSQVMRYGKIVRSKDNSIVGNAYRWVYVIHHGLQFQFELKNGNVECVKMSTQNNLFEIN